MGRACRFFCYHYYSTKSDGKIEMNCIQTMCGRHQKELSLMKMHGNIQLDNLTDVILVYTLSTCRVLSDRMSSHCEFCSASFKNNMIWLLLTVGQCEKVGIERLNP